jgi:hypothetical protein
LSVATTPKVTLALAITLGAPVINPVVAFNVSPLGKPPAGILYVIDVAGGTGLAVNKIVNWAPAVKEPKFD